METKKQNVEQFADEQAKQTKKVENSNQKKSRADISIEEINRLFIEHGFEPPKLVNKTGSFCIIPTRKK